MCYLLSKTAQNPEFLPNFGLFPSKRVISSLETMKKGHFLPLFPEGGVQGVAPIYEIHFYKGYLCQHKKSLFSLF